MADAVHPHAEELRSADGSWKYTNRLIDETSPYLLQHAHNPVDWWPWGEAAFERARQLDRPLFVSIGYSTCYWCHVMERQVFENPRLAKLLNQACVAVKVDREERPDIDEVYMTATQMMTGRGGWPMSLFLTPPGAQNEDDPGLKPFWAGTYVPPEPMHGVPGFGQLVEGLAEAWQHQRQGVLGQAERLAAAVVQHLRHEHLGGPLRLEAAQKTANQLLSVYDQQHGGFGTAPKFPQPSNIDFLLAVQQQVDNPDLVHAIAYTLERMARGGIYDQVGGGFHRYSVDEKWLVPHFEKMLYDTAQLVETYAGALEQRVQPARRRLHERVIRESCDWVMREMTDASGAFYSALDAEVEAREGASYLWTRREVEQALEDRELARVAVLMYGLDRGTNFRDPHDASAAPANVLYLPHPLPDLAERLGVSLPELEEVRRRINRQLLAVRDQRPRPARDEKVLTAWNGMMIAGLARAGRVLGEARYVDAAERAARAVIDHLGDGRDGLLRTMRAGEAKIPGFLEDYAFFVHGLIELHRARPGAGANLELARQYGQAAVDRFAAAQGGYYDTLEGAGELFLRVRTIHDGAVASGNSQMVHDLLDLFELTGERDWVERASKDLAGHGRALQEQGVAVVHLQHALLRLSRLAPDRIEPPAESAPKRAGRKAESRPVSAWVEPGEVDLSSGEASVQVHVQIKPPYHLNAFEPGEPDLVPTQLRLVGAEGLSLRVAYPEGEARQYAFADQPLAVYEGEVVLDAHLLRRDTYSSGPVKLVLRYQPCTDETCLAPEMLELPLTIRESA
ncbi:MAG: thioredoxin domain-containing protein [Phycisphaeraceae bacterium]